MKTYDVFISYRRTNPDETKQKAGYGGSEVAELLYRYLTAKGLRVFYDKIEMPDGHYFPDSIAEAIKIAPHYILVGSTDAFIYRNVDEEKGDLDYVKYEVELAVAEYEKNKAERTITVIQTVGATIPDISTLPEKVRNITKAQRKVLQYGSDDPDIFYEILKSVTNVNHRNLWFAAHRWLENNKQPGGRFASLNINENILPNVSKTTKTQQAMPINVYSKEKQNECAQPLLEAMGVKNSHLYLIGQGGIGKTTALMHIMNSAYTDKQYSKNAQVPIFVELSFAPDTNIEDKNGNATVYADGKSSFIRRSVFKQLRTDRTLKQISEEEAISVDDVFKLPKDSAVEPVEVVFMQKKPIPEYLLLLDGLNEVSTVIIEETGLSVVQMIMREIDMLIAECPNVRVVLTSRSDDAAIYNDSVSRLYLSGIDEKIIREYLENTGLSGEHIDKALADDNLREILNIPLFLTMYASLSECDEASTQGEILKLFFNERRRNISVYTMQDRLSAVERNIEKSSSVQKNRIDADMQNFILDFILPEIAWHMERNNEYYLRVRDIRKIIEPILMDVGDLSVCGDFGREIFNKYNNNSTDITNTYITAKKIIEKMGADLSLLSERILKCCVFAFGIMQENNSRYGFVHQHIRDYFAAVKNINTIRLSVYLYEVNEKELALECMNKTFKDEPVNHTVRRFMGEYLGEHRNKPYYANAKWNYGVPKENCDRTLIKRALDVYRGYFDGECGYGIYSLIQILIEIRKDLSGSDLSILDLQHVCFKFDTVLGQKDCVADFIGTKIDDSNFLLANHSDHFSKISLKPDGTEVATVIGESLIVIWDLRLKKQLHVLRQHTKSINSICYSLDGKYFVSCSKDNTAIVWDAITYEKITSLSTERFDFNILFEDEGIKLSGFSPDSKELFILDSEDKITIFDVATFSKKRYINCSNVFWGNDDKLNRKVYKGLFNVFMLDSKKIIGVFLSGEITEWNTETGDITFEKNYGDIEHVAYSPENKYLIYSIADKLYVFDLINYKIVKEIAHGEEINNICFVAEKQILIVSDYYNMFLYDVNSGACLNKREMDNIIKDLSNVEGNKVAICDSKNVYIYNINSMLIEFSINNYNKHGHCVTYSNDGRYFAIPTSDAMVKIFDAKNKICINQLQGYKKNVLHLQFSNNDKSLVSVSKDNTLKIWNIYKSECIATLKHDSPIYSVDMDNDGKYLLSACNEKVLLWDIELNTCVKTFTGFGGKLNDAKFSPDFKYIVAVSDRYIKIIDAIKQKILKTFSNSKEGMRYCSARTVEFFNNSQRVAIKYIDESISILNLQNLAIEKKIEPSKIKSTSQKIILGIGASPFYTKLNNVSDKIDGTFDYEGFISSKDKYIATVSSTNEAIYIFSTKDYKLIREIKQMSHLPQFVKFSPNERFLITSTVNSNYVSVWDIENNKMYKLKKHESNIISAFFSNDGKKIISMSKDDIIKIHSAETFECMDEIQLSDGYNVLNVNFQNIHTDSELSEKKKNMLKTYGAIID